MAKRLTDFHPVSRITIGAVGEPGKRIFLLQATNQNSISMTLKIEKEQARVLAASTMELLDELDEKFSHTYSQLDEPLGSDLMLHDPMEPEFIVGQIGLGYDEEEDMIVLVVQEVQLEEDQLPFTARFWATRSQMKALSDHTLEVVEQGRPTCPLCNAPIDPEGHFCPKTNGYERVSWV
jgi:uncharacterized repeat protein (TIGR03847 family)